MEPNREAGWRVTDTRQRELSARTPEWQEGALRVPLFCVCVIEVAALRSIYSPGRRRSVRCLDSRSTLATFAAASNSARHCSRPPFETTKTTGARKHRWFLEETGVLFVRGSELPTRANSQGMGLDFHGHCHIHIVEVDRDVAKIRVAVFSANREVVADRVLHAAAEGPAAEADGFTGGSGEG